MVFFFILFFCLFSGCRHKNNHRSRTRITTRSIIYTCAVVCAALYFDVLFTGTVVLLLFEFDLDYVRYISAHRSRSPRWTIESGSPRTLLLGLIRELESHHGEILNLFAKMKKGQLLKAPGVGKHNSTRVDEGRKS